MRIRTVKPAFFKDEDLAERPPLTRILFAGLWCMADGEGRLEYRPKFIKIEILPYDQCDVEAMLQDLHTHEFIKIYEVGDRRYIQVTTFEKHQRISGREAEEESEFPEPPTMEAAGKQSGNIAEAVNVQEGKGKEGKGKEDTPAPAPAVVHFKPRKTVRRKEDDKGSPNWSLLVDHIKRKWEYKKRPHGKFAPSGQDFALLKRKISVYDAFELMGLYDEFIVNTDPFYAKQGHTITAFCGAIDHLLDSSGWKAKAEKYRATNLKPATQEEKENVEKIGSLVNGIVKTGTAI